MPGPGAMYLQAHPSPERDGSAQSGPTAVQLPTKMWHPTCGDVVQAGRTGWAARTRRQVRVGITVEKSSINFSRPDAATAAPAPYDKPWWALRVVLRRMLEVTC